MTVAATAISDKELRKVASAALRRGWTLVRLGNGTGHFQLQIDSDNGKHSHVATVSCSPSDVNAHKSLQRAILRCVAGKCGHGGAAAEVDTDASRRREAKARAERVQLEALERIANLPAVEPVRRTEPTVVKPKRKVASPKYERALKWARWYVDSPAMGGPARPNEAVQAAALKAGHSWPLARRALIEAGAVPLSRGRGGTTWTYPQTEGGQGSNTLLSVDESVVDEGQAHTLPATPVSSGERDSEVAVEWARLEGMAMVADLLLRKNNTLANQIAKLRTMIEGADR